MLVGERAHEKLVRLCFQRLWTDLAYLKGGGRKKIRGDKRHQVSRDNLIEGRRGLREIAGGKNLDLWSHIEAWGTPGSYVIPRVGVLKIMPKKEPGGGLSCEQKTVS